LCLEHKLEFAHLHILVIALTELRRVVGDARRSELG
jgi:hypothetical protein